MDDDIEPASDVSTSESDDVAQTTSALDNNSLDNPVELPVDDPSYEEDGNDKLDNLDNDLLEMTKSLTTDTDYSGVDIANVIEGTMSQSSSNDTLSSVAQSTVGPEDHNALRVEECQDRLSVHSEEVEMGMDVTEAIQLDSGNGSIPPREGHLGSINDTDEVPLVYLTRLLCHRFLLMGYQHGLIPDRRVRVSVKVLALSCIGHIFELYPRAFLKKLHKSSSEPGGLKQIKF